MTEVKDEGSGAALTFFRTGERRFQRKMNLLTSSSVTRTPMAFMRITLYITPLATSKSRLPPGMELFVAL